MDIPCRGVYLFNIRYLYIHTQSMHTATMKTRRTHAQVVADRRAQNVRNLAGPIARLRAARRAERHAQRSPHDIARHLRDHAKCSLLEIAAQLEHMGYRTPRGGLRWSAEQVRRELKRTSVRDAVRDVPSVGRRGHQWVRVPRFRAGESRRSANTDQPLHPMPAVARDQWYYATVDMPPSLPRPPEPLLDSRGRVLKGRRFSKIKPRTA